MSWSSTVPTTATLASQTPTFYRGNWTAIENFISAEHYTFTNELSGMHIVGAVGAIAEGTTTELDDISATPGSGALSFDTTLGAWKFCSNGTSGDGWKTVHKDLPTTRIHSVSFGDEPIAAGAYVFMSFGTEIYDSLGEFIASVFTAKEAGYFIVTATTMISSAINSVVTIGVSGTGANDSISTVLCTNYQTMSIGTIAYVPLDGKLGVYIQSSSAAIASGGPNINQLVIHRVS